jgi:hypothetical protein
MRLVRLMIAAGFHGSGWCLRTVSVRAIRSSAHLEVLGHPVFGMTSRTTPVGAVVLMLASLFVVGCTAQTGAVFEALLDPAAVPASPSEGDAADGAAQIASGGGALWEHPDGYAMRLPSGWSGIATDAANTDQLIDAVASDNAIAAGRIDGVLGTTNSRVSAVAADLDAEGAISPLMIIVAQPTDGQRGHAVKSRVRQQINDLPGRDGRVIRRDVRLPAGSAAYFEFTVADPDLGEFSVSSYLFKFANQAYLVTFVASDDVFEDQRVLFEAIASSLIFGV